MEREKVKAIYWGPGPLPMGAEIVGEYQNGIRRGALIRLANGNYVQGNAGAIRAVVSALDMLSRKSTVGE